MNAFKVTAALCLDFLNILVYLPSFVEETRVEVPWSGHTSEKSKCCLRRRLRLWFLQTGTTFLGLCYPCPFEGHLTERSLSTSHSHKWRMTDFDSCSCHFVYDRKSPKIWENRVFIFHRKKTSNVSWKLKTEQRRTTVPVKSIQTSWIFFNKCILNYYWLVIFL